MRHLERRNPQKKKGYFYGVAAYDEREPNHIVTAMRVLPKRDFKTALIGFDGIGEYKPQWEVTGCVLMAL